MREIERKFLVTTLPDYVKSCEYSNITQWYITKPTDSIENRFRCYTTDDGSILKSYFDIKIGTGMIREEIGQKVDYKTFSYVMKNYPSISKRRYRVVKEDHTIFVDIYKSGLMTAEIEVTEDRISWLDRYVPEDWMILDRTGNVKYKNITLAYENF